MFNILYLVRIVENLQFTRLFRYFIINKSVLSIIVEFYIIISDPLLFITNVEPAIGNTMSVV